MNIRKCCGCACEGLGKWRRHYAFNIQNQVGTFSCSSIQAQPPNNEIQRQVSSICSALTSSPLQASPTHHLLKGFEPSLSSPLVFQVLQNYKLLGRLRTLEFFSWAASHMRFQFDDSVVHYMADFLARRKLFDDLRCFLLSVKSHNGPLSTRTFSTCIRYLGRQGLVDEALSLFKDIGSKFECEPDNFVYNNMLYVLCKRNASEHSINLALDIFRRIQLPDTYSYSNIVLGLCKFNSLDKALEVFGDMCKAGLVPTRSATNLLIGTLCSLSSKDDGMEKVRVRNTRRPFTILIPNVSDVKSGAIKPAIEVFWTVRDLGLLPSSFVIVQLLTELCRVGKIDEAVEVLKVVERAKASCCGESYTVVLNAMCSHRRVEGVSRLFRRMLALRMKPKVAVYNSVISMLCKIGNLDDAEMVYKIMNKNRCEPNSVTYSMLIHGHVEARNWEASYELLMEMMGFGLKPHFHTYDIVLKLLLQSGKMDMCLKLERRLESQALRKLCKSGRVNDAYEKLEAMLDKGLYPPRYVKDAFELAFEKSGNRKLAQDLLERVDKAQSKEKKMEIFK